MPPVTRNGVQVEYDDSTGQVIHTFRQSTLSELDTCPERGRLTLTGQMPKQETDAAALGTSAHHGIEAAEHALLDDEILDPETIAELMVDEFDRISEDPLFEWKKYNRDKIVDYLTSIAHVFHDVVYPTLDPRGIEIPFDGLTIHKDDEREIRLNGTIDLFDGHIGAADWKTASDGRKFRGGWGGEAWKLERWEIQPTLYVQALLLLGYLDPDAEEWPFTFLPFTLESGGEVSFQPLTVYRHQGDLDWLVEKCVSYAKLVEAEVTPWPKQDNHALCSEKWCPAWDQCKGAYYQLGWPKPSRPA